MKFQFDQQDPSRFATLAYAAAHPSSQTASVDPLFVFAHDPAPSRRVALVSGGGTGHEPLHGGLVGRGGLDAAVTGRVFASPHSRQIYHAARHVAKEEGVLFLVKNYTGDVLNFRIAAERLRADGIPVETVIVADDVATFDPAEESSGMRGTAGAVIVEQVLGVVADRGAGLAELVALGRSVGEASRSFSAAVEAHHSHIDGLRAFTTDGVEFGVGIHGERSKETLVSVSEGDVVSRMLDAVADEFLGEDGRVALLCNNLGAMSALEIAAVSGFAASRLVERGLTVALTAQGAFVTALDMRGFSLTVVKVDPDLERLLLTHTSDLPFPRWDRWAPTALAAVPQTAASPVQESTPADVPLPADSAVAAAARLMAIAQEPLTRLDQLAGDGDFGDNLAFGVTNAGARLRSDGELSAAAALSESFLDDVGGSSGPLFGLVLRALVPVFEPGATWTPHAMQEGLQRGVDAVRAVGGAERGDSTLLDAAYGALDAIAAEDAPTPSHIVEGAILGAESTRQAAARRGRARYLGERTMGIPDPGAVGMTLLLAVLLSTEDETLESRATDYIRELRAELESRGADAGPIPGPGDPGE